MSAADAPPTGASAIVADAIARGSAATSNAPRATESRIASAVAAMGEGELSAAGLASHVRPLFGRVLAEQRGAVYLANHSLGRPLDATADDLAEGASLWYARMGDAWDDWMAELAAYRARLARLLNAPRADCVIPKTSAGQGLRAVLNTADSRVRVVATRGEFDSLDVILRHYARRGRIELTWVEPGADGYFAAEAVAHALAGKCDLLVISHAMFATGQVLSDLGHLVEYAHQCGARVLLDVYHSLGALPVDVSALDVDFAVGGAYKYLRGGPGACFLHVHPRWLDGALSTLDVGWFGKRDPFSYRRPEPPEFGAGGDAFLESTPPVLTWYQARAGQVLALALRPARLRTWSLGLQVRLRTALERAGVESRGGDADHGAFVVVQHARAEELAERLRRRGVLGDARGPWLRLCPDILTTDDEIARAAQLAGEEFAALGRGA